MILLGAMILIFAGGSGMLFAPDRRWQEFFSHILVIGLGVAIGTMGVLILS